MRAISFMLTQQQVRDEQKTVTRRCNWKFLKPGDRLKGVEKCQGLKKGEHQVLLKIIEVVDVRRELLMSITPADVSREGFPNMTCWEFVQLYCKHNKGCLPSSEITRIEFKYVKA